MSRVRAEDATAVTGGVEAAAAAIEIDGSDGEGGGQIFRLSMGLSAVTGLPVRIHSVRANRPKPGLAAQHLACVRAVQASVDGAALKSLSVTLTPATICGGDYSVDIGSQGSCALVVQAILPVMMQAPSPCTFSIDGGTHVNFAPPYQALQHVILPVISRFGVSAKCDCQAISLYRNGAPPSSRGRLHLSVTPCPNLRPLQLLELGCVVSVRCWCVSDAACSAAAGEALAACAAAAASAFPGAVLHSEAVTSDELAGAGPRLSLSACIGLCVESSTGCVLGADRLLLDVRPNAGSGGARVKDGLHVARAVVEEVAAAVRAGACVDHRTCDQLPVFMSLAAGPSRVRVQPVSDHVRSACAVAAQFTGAAFQVEPCENGCVVLSCTPRTKLLNSDSEKPSVVCAPHARDAATASLAPVAAAGRKSSGCRLFVGNLAWTTTDQDLQKHIGQVGGVLNAEVALCASNSRSKGYGTVEMATSQDASHAIQTLNNSELHGRSIVVRYDQKAR